MEEDNRQVIEDLVREKILGPGYAKDIIVCNDDASDEVVYDEPSRLYSTGIMTPSGTKSSDTDEDEETIDDNDTGGVNVDNDGNGTDDSTGGSTSQSDDNQSEKEDRSFFESDHIGVVTCVSGNTQNIRIEVSYAKYEPVAVPEVIIKAGFLYDNLRQIIIDNSQRDEVVRYLSDNNIQIPLNELFVFNDDNKTVSLRQAIAPSINQVLTVSNTPEMELLKILLRGKFFRRMPFFVSQEVNMNDVRNRSVMELTLNDDLKCFIKWFPSKPGEDKEYFKVIVRNQRTLDADGQGNAFYRQCLFQSVLKVTPLDGSLVSYTEPIVSLDDEENNINEYIYRDVINYGKGIGCAAEWDEDGQWIATTYMPRCEVKKFSNQIDDDDITAICTLRNISIWGVDDDDLLNGLERFVEGYGNWHQEEVDRSANHDAKYNDAVETILCKQKVLLNRLRDNIQFMRDNPEALTCFRIANTAMLIQMVVARDNNFVKNRTAVDDNPAIFDSIDYFRDAQYMPTMRNTEPSYRPFQLAFLLMNVKSTMVEDDVNRTTNVDLIWFPTGGGKTEAYLALTALTIIARRRNSADIISGANVMRDAEYTSGVSVIMRYTLRLLASQQFERASFLICAMDFLRVKCPELNLGNIRISIGLWVGKATSPNAIAELQDNNEKYRRFLYGVRPNNPFPVAYCPWCGQSIYLNNNQYGYSIQDGKIECLNDSCHFMTDVRLPIYYIDEVIYREKPTLLFATVDKFAQLYNPNPAGLIRTTRCKTPDLIIQDELHLISGPLGSTVSLFESIVEELASRDGHRPKIIASTATTRNTGALIKSLYGRNREVSIFPAQGTSYRDNYFSHLEADALRCHVGIMPTGRTTSNDTEIRLTATLILARAKLAMKLLADARVDICDVNAVVGFLRDDHHNLKTDLDLFWSIVLYYNSLKDLGRSKSRASQEVYENLRAKLPSFQIPQSLEFIYKGFNNRKKEFTSREDSSRIKKLLTDAETTSILEDWDHGVGINSETMDLIYASNMISVGIDIDRWNIMMMMGQPRSTSEYIQSSSRVARSHKGLVYNLINPQRNREFSLFENYTSFHSAYYKYVEPLSATPMNSQMLSLPLWHNIVQCYKLFIAPDPTDEDAIEEGIMDMLSSRYSIDNVMENQIRQRLSYLLHNDNEDYMSSLRDIDDDCYIMINGLSY